jgi:hypothetical protein
MIGYVSRCTHNSLYLRLYALSSLFVAQETEKKQNCSAQPQMKNCFATSLFLVVLRSLAATYRWYRLDWLYFRDYQPTADHGRLVLLQARRHPRRCDAQTLATPEFRKRRDPGYRKTTMLRLRRLRGRKMGILALQPFDRTVGFGRVEPFSSRQLCRFQFL